MNLSTFWAWTVDHAFLVLSGLYVASIVCSAMLAIVVYRLHRQQENLAERHRASFDSMSKRLQGLDDRLAILTLSVGNQPARVGSVSASTAQAEENEAANSSLQAIRQEIERLTTQLGEQDYSGCIGADAQHDKVKNAFTETKSNRG